MALQVWLPLRGDLKNLGLSDVNITNKGATIDDNGKIGKCYKNIANGNCISLDGYMTTLKTYQKYSMCAWVYISELSTGHSASILSSGNWNHPDGNLCFALYSKVSNGYTSILIPNKDHWNNSISASQTLTIGNWYHICITYDSSVTKLYINGQYKGSKAIGGICSVSNSNNLYIGAATYVTYFTLKGSLNDVRVYDHCLSPKEVKEISLGLVLHYKLDNYIGENLIDNSSNITTGWGKYTSVSTLTYENGKVKAVASSSGMPRIFNKTVLPYASVLEYYTIYVDYICQSDISIHGKSSSSVTELNESGSQSIGTIKKLYQINSENNHKIVVFSWLRPAATDTIKASWWMISFGVNTTLYINLVKVEKGLNKQIIWTPYNTKYSIVYDSSGYENNGNILSTIILNQDSSRYNYSFEFNGDTSGIIVENLNIGNIINTAMSYSFWIKPNGENGSRSVYFGSYSGTSFSIEKTASNKLRLWWNSSPDLTSNLTITDNQWQHIVITKTGTTEIKVYLNGILIQTLTNTYNNVRFPTTYRIGRDTRTGTTSYKGLMSDFRIYATALSDEDIKELYNTSAIIDNNLNFYTLEFQELNNSRELIGALHAFYRSTGSNPVKNSDGSITINGHTWIKSDPLWSGYIPINPVGKTYYYDIEYSNNEGNLFYIGFSKYDANKGTGSNEECQYVVNRKTAVDHKRVSGIINLSTANGNTAAFTQVRVLNQWTGSTSGVAGVSTIYHLSLREVEGTPETLLINKNGISLSDEFTELNSTEVRKNGITTINQLIEI